MSGDDLAWLAFWICTSALALLVLVHLINDLLDPIDEIRDRGPRSKEE